MSTGPTEARGGRTGYRSDPLRVTDRTEPVHIRRWAERCIENPHKVGDITVYNFSTHRINETWLRDAAPRLPSGRYVIPLQLESTWFYLQQILPRPLRRADYLIHSQRKGTYVRQENYLKDADRDKQQEWLANMAAKVREDGQ